MWIKTVFIYFLIIQHSSPIRLGSPPPLSVFNGHTRPVILNQSQANVLTYLFKTPTCVHMLLQHTRATPQPNGRMGKKAWNLIAFTTLCFENTTMLLGHMIQKTKVWGVEICFYANFNCTEHNEFHSVHHGQQEHIWFFEIHWNASICVGGNGSVIVLQISHH